MKKLSPIVGMREIHFVMEMRTTKIMMIVTIMWKMRNRRLTIATGLSFMTLMVKWYQCPASLLTKVAKARARWSYLRKLISLLLLLIALRKTIFLSKKSANLINKLVKLFSKVKSKIHPLMKLNQKRRSNLRK